MTEYVTSIDAEQLRGLLTVDGRTMRSRPYRLCLLQYCAIVIGESGWIVSSGVWMDIEVTYCALIDESGRILSIFGVTMDFSSPVVDRTLTDREWRRSTSTLLHLILRNISTILVDVRLFIGPPKIFKLESIPWITPWISPQNENQSDVLYMITWSFYASSTSGRL